MNRHIRCLQGFTRCGGRSRRDNGRLFIIHVPVDEGGSQQENGGDGKEDWDNGRGLLLFQNRFGKQIPAAYPVDAFIKIFRCRGETVLIADGINILRKVFRKGKILQHDGDDVFPETQCLGDLRPYPVIRRSAPVKGMRGEDQNEIRAGTDGVEKGFIKTAGTQDGKIVKNPVAAFLERFVKIHGGHVAAIPAITDKDIT